MTMGFLLTYTNLKPQRIRFYMSKDSKNNLGTILTSIAGLLIVINLLFLKDGKWSLIIAIISAVIAIVGLVLYEKEKKKSKN